MKLSFPVTLGLAAFAAASPVGVMNKDIVNPPSIGKRCFLWHLFVKPPCPPPGHHKPPGHPKPPPPPPENHNPPPPKPTPPKPTPPNPTTPPCTTPTTATPPCTTPTTPPCTTPTTPPACTDCPSTTSSTTPPGPEPTGPQTKRDDENDNLAQLFNFIDAANEEDVNQFIHFYKNADKGDVEAWWNGETVNSEFAPSFPASRVHEIADSEIEKAST